MNIFQQIIDRCELLGIEFFPIVFLSFDVLLLCYLSAGLLRSLKFTCRRSAESWVAVGTVFLSWVVLTATLLGAFGFLEWKTLLVLHIVLAVVLPFVQREKGYKNAFRQNGRALHSLFAALFRPLIRVLTPSQWTRKSWGLQLLTLAMILLLSFFAFLAVFNLPLNYDSNLYRLTRIGMWLQEKNIYHFGGSNMRIPRHNLMAQNAALVMLWLTSFFRYGFPLVHLAQFFGGLMSCGAVYEFSRVLGFSPFYRVGAVVTLLGMPNVATQFFSSQTDLFTTGCLVLGLLWLFRALKSSSLQHWFLAGCGLGLAIGAKGTVFYWGAGLVWLGLAWLLIFRPPWKAFLRGFLLASCCVIVLGGFNYAQNMRAYGSLFGPKEKVGNKIERLKSAPVNWEKSLMKGRAYLWQIFETYSQLPFIRPATNPIFENLERTILAMGSLDDTPVSISRAQVEEVKESGIRSAALLEALYACAGQEFSSYNGFIQVVSQLAGDGLTERERKTLGHHFAPETDSLFPVRRFRAASEWLRHGLSEDYASFGAPIFFVAILGGGLSVVVWLRFRKHQALQVFILWTSACILLGSIISVLGWTVHKFRYFVLAGPFLAIVAVYVLTAFSFKRRRLLTAIFLSYQVMMAAYVGIANKSHGLLATLDLRSISVFPMWFEPVKMLDQLDRTSTKLALSLHGSQWTAPYFRRPFERQIDFVENSVLTGIESIGRFLQETDYEVLIATTSLLKVPAGNVRVSTNTAKTVMVMRLATEEEKLPPVLKNIQGLYRDGWSALHCSFDTESCCSDILTLYLNNQTPLTRQVELKSSREGRTVVLKAWEKRKVKLQIHLEDQVSLEISPPFIPSKVDPSSPDRRELGLFISWPE